MGGDDQKLKSQFDVISIGDAVTDAFIKLLDDKAHAYKNEHGKWLAMELGSKIPFDHAEIKEAVGNSPNAAVSFAKLGLNSGLVANVGGDSHGRDMINALQKKDVDTRFVHINPGMISNYHFVLWYKEERTILIKHEEYKYHWPHFRLHEKPKWLYFSSISKNALGMHDEMADWLELNKDVKLAFQPGTFQIDAGIERLAKLYKHTEVLLLNREEATELSKGKHEDINNLFDKLHAIGPKIVVITDGPDGAYACDGHERFKMPPYPDAKPPFERTGAGDAFSSTFVAALIKGNNIEGAMQWAPINAMNVVQKVGAQDGLLTEDQITDYLEKAPDWYKPTSF